MDTSPQPTSSMPNRKPQKAESSKPKSHHVHHWHVGQVVIISSAIIVPLLYNILSYVGINSYWKKLFVGLFFFRYVKLIVNTISWCLAKPYLAPVKPTYTLNDVTVVIPTTNPESHEFRDTVMSALDSGAGAVIVVTVGEQRLQLAHSWCSDLDGASRLQILQIDVMNKREQMCHGVAKTKTAITVFCDDHVFWPKGFLKSILAPFEDPKIGAVGTHKRVRRIRDGSFWNFLGCLYLERHNMEILATNRLDGGVFIISARTAAYRTCIIQDPKFIHGFLNEYCFFGLVGPLNADDDNFMMRWLVTYDWKMWVQNGDDALIETTINNSWDKFRGQCIRWVRTTWRSNPRSLLEGKVIFLQPWSLYATYISLFVNFAAIVDPTLVVSLYLAVSDQRHPYVTLAALAFWIFCSKLVKITPHLWRNPRDVIWVPFYILFGYFHGALKLWALVTFWNTSWGSRPEVDAEAAKPLQANVEAKKEQ